MLVLVRELEPARVVGVGVKICEHFIHAAEFRRQHFLNLIAIEIGENAFRPAGELDLDVEGLLVSSQMVGIAQTGEELVLDIPGRPEAVKVEAAGSNLTLAEILIANLASHALRILLSTDVAVTLRFLNLRKLRNHVVYALLEAHVTC